MSLFRAYNHVRRVGVRFDVFYAWLQEFNPVRHATVAVQDFCILIGQLPKLFYELCDCHTCVIIT